MKRYNRNFAKSNFFCISKSGQVLIKKEFLTSESVKFWRFFPESYFLKRQNTSLIKPSTKTIYLFTNW